MSKIKVGQIRKDALGLYIITDIKSVCGIIYQNGKIDVWSEKQLECDELIAEFPTWQEAVNSKEFNNEA